MRMATALVALALALGGCGTDEEHPTRFEDAVATVGDGVSPTGTGVGWVDLDALGPSDLGWAARALTPQASAVLDSHAGLARTTGFDPAAASQALSVGGSFAFAVRFDDVSPGRLPELLRRAGAKEAGTEGRWTRFDLGSEFEGAPATPLAPLSSLVSRTAVAANDVALARIEYARKALIAAEGGGLEGGRIELATDCLGDVDAARIVPGAFTHNQVSAPATIAFGVAPRGEDGTRPEVLCAIDLPSSPISDRPELVERALDPDAADAVTGEPMRDLISGFEVETSTGPEDEAVTRVELTRPAGAAPGLLLTAFYRGSLLTYLGSPEP
jgi:hypothetical protein